jgi:hypothetical protein
MSEISTRNKTNTQKIIVLRTSRSGVKSGDSICAGRGRILTDPSAPLIKCTKEVKQWQIDYYGQLRQSL